MFRKFNSADRELTSIQQNIEQAFRRLFKGSFLDNTTLEGVNLAVGENKLEHKLLRKVRGYVVVKKSAASEIYDTASDEKTITLNASAACTVSILIY